MRYATATVSFTRPADTTQYGLADAISDATTTATAATFAIPGMASVNGGFGRIHSLTLHKSDQDLTGADFDVAFFTGQPVATGFDDNAALAITDTEWKQCVGVVPLTAAANGASVANGDLFCARNVNLVYKCETSVRSLYFVVVARGTYTPASAEVFTLTVGYEMA